MIDKFETGHWYRWTGPKERQSDWNYGGGMDFILDGKPHKIRWCCGARADFEGNERRDSPCPYWSWEGYEKYFEECPAPFRGCIIDITGPAIIPLSPRCKCTISGIQYSLDGKKWIDMIKSYSLYKITNRHSRRKTILSRLSIE